MLVLWVVLTIGATAVYIALAIAGWGWRDVTGFFAHPARAATVVVTVALALAGTLTRGNLSAGEREDRANRWVLGAFGVLGVLAGVLPAYADRRALWVIDGDGVRWLGVALFTAGGILRLWPVFVLGARFSGLVAIQPGHRLVTTGIYGAIRHPSYLGLLINALGWALVFRSVIGVLLAVAMIVPVIGRIRAEERLLGAQFGSAYDDYRAHTARLIPGVY